MLNLIDHLPGDSEFVEAYVNDPQVAEAIVAGEVKVPERAPGPRISEYSADTAKLAEISDKLSSLIQIQVARGGKPPPKMQPSARPGTAMAAARRNAARRNAAKIVELFTPGEAGQI